MKNSNKLGIHGEHLACFYLQQLGYKIVATNVLVGHGEIDIIAEFKKRTIFIEVKTRASTFLGSARDQLSQQKLRRFKQAAQVYIRKNRLDYDKINLEFLAIDIDSGGENHFELFTDII